MAGFDSVMCSWRESLLWWRDWVDPGVLFLRSTLAQPNKFRDDESRKICPKVLHVHKFHAMSWALDSGIVNSEANQLGL